MELRELRLHGWKPRTGDGAAAVMYKGPLESVSCECGMIFRRGEIVNVSGLVAGWLRSGPSADQFSF